MAKREWGAKHTCVSCGVKFYDLHRKPIACPKCGTEVEVEAPRPNRRRPPAPPEPPEPTPPAAEEAAIAADPDETDDDDSDDLIDDIDDDGDLVGGIDDAKPAQPES